MNDKLQNTMTNGKPLATLDRHHDGRLRIVCPGNIVDADAFTGATLDSVRHQLPRGLHFIGRKNGDEPQIVEAWV